MDTTFKPYWSIFYLSKDKFPLTDCLVAKVCLSIKGLKKSTK